MSCGCNNWPWSNSVADHCGAFDDDTATPDQGRCHPYRLKTSCAAPELPYTPSPEPPYGPVDSCGNPIVYVSTPDLTPPLRVLAYLTDEDCNRITDEDGDPITTYIT